MRDIGWSFSILRVSGLFLGALTNLIFVCMTMSGTPKSQVLGMLFIRTFVLSLPFALWAGISIFKAKPTAENFYHHLACLILVFMFPIFFIVDATLIAHPPGELFPTSVLIIGSFPITVPLLFVLAKPLGPRLQKLLSNK